MNFWKMHDLALISIRQEAIKITENFEGRNIGDKNYTDKLNQVLNEKLGDKTKFLTESSMCKTIKSINRQNTNI